MRVACTTHNGIVITIGTVVVAHFNCLNRTRTRQLTGIVVVFARSCTIIYTGNIDGIFTRDATNIVTIGH